MKPFKLHTVLNHRQNLENMAMQRLSLSQQEVEVIQEKMKTKDELLFQVSQEFERLKQEEISIDKVILYQNHIHVLREKISSLGTDLLKAEEQAEIKREDLLEAVRDKKLLKKLKEKQDHCYLGFLVKKEDEEMDEIAGLHIGRQDI